MVVIPAKLTLAIDQQLVPVYTDDGRTVLRRQLSNGPLVVHQKCGLKHTFYFDAATNAWKHIAETDGCAHFAMPYWSLVGFGVIAPLELPSEGTCTVYGRRFDSGDVANDISVFGFPAEYRCGYLRVFGPDSDLCQRLYREGEGDWKYSDSFFAGDWLTLSHVAAKAFDFCEEAKREAATSSSAESGAESADVPYLRSPENR